MRREIAVEALEIVRSELNNQVAYIDALEDSLTLMRSMGIINVRAQSERLTEQMAIAILEGKQKAVNELKIQLDTLSKYAGIFTSLEDEKVLEKKRLSLIRSKFRESEVDANKSLQHKFIVNNAYPAEKKAYPIRWLIVVISTFATFLLTLVFILFMESIKSINFK